MNRSLRRLLLTLPLLAAFWGCATTSAQKAGPVVAASDAPQRLVLLGAEYQLPPFMELATLDAKPGVTHIDWEDTVTRCGGHALFETVGEPKDHDTYITSLTSEFEVGWKKENVLFERAESTTPWLGGLARVINYGLKEAATGGVGATTVIDRHFPAEALSIVMSFDCPSPGLVQKQIATLSRWVDTQKKL